MVTIPWLSTQHYARQKRGITIWLWLMPANMEMLPRSKKGIPK